MFLECSLNVPTQTVDNSEQLAELGSLRNQVVNHAKERAALKTILESKISTLVNGISHSLREDPEFGHKNPRLTREVHALEKLVNATINAMRSTAPPSGNAA